MFNIPDGLDSDLKRVLRDIQAELYRIRKGSGTPQVSGGVTNTFYPISNKKSEPREISGDYTIHGNLFVDGGINGTSMLDRLTTVDPTPSTLILSDDNTDQILTGSLGALKHLTTAGVYSFGSVTANTDITLNFPGTTTSGQFKWMEDEDWFQFEDNILLSGTKALYFRDTFTGISSPIDGYMVYEADINHWWDINGTTRMSLSVLGQLTLSNPTPGNTLLRLMQNDIDEAFVRWDGTSAADSTRSISTQNGDGIVEGPKNFLTANGWAFSGMLRMDVNGATRWIPFYVEDTA